MNVAVDSSSRSGWLDAEEQQVWRALLNVHGRVVARLDEELQIVHGIGLADYDVLVQLSEAPGRSLRMAELAGRLQLSPSGLTRRIDSLVRRGLVAREACESDGRGSFAVLTTQGLAQLQEAAPTHVAGVRAYVFDTLDRQALAHLADGLAAISAALDGAVTPPRSAGSPGPAAVTTGDLDELASR
jgi:DNA-binding MarR family transcriptional regulator